MSAFLTLLQTYVAAHPVLHAACTGAWGAAAADIGVFLGYRSWTDWRAFDLRVASYRWVHGAVATALLASGYHLVAGTGL